MSQPLGDITPEEFQDAAGFLTDWLSSYLSKPEVCLLTCASIIYRQLW